MADAIIVCALLVAVVLALLRARNHFHGGCCGGGGNTIREHKTLTEPVLGRKELTIEGMRCENCAARIENALNRLDGVLAKVSLRRRRAEVAYSRAVSDEALKNAVEALGYRVTAIAEKGA